jgi:hypothetical protein
MLLPRIEIIMVRNSGISKFLLKKDRGATQKIVSDLVEKTLL